MVKTTQVNTLDFSNAVHAICTAKTPTLDYRGKQEKNRYISKNDEVLLGKIDESLLIPVKYPTSSGSRIAYLNSLDNFKYDIVIYNQNDYSNIPYPAPGYENATIASSGCGVCCAAMIVSNLVQKVSVAKMTLIATNCGARVSGGTDLKRLSKKLVSEYGLVFSTSNDIEEVENHLLNGGMVIANVDGDKGNQGIFSTGGHYIVLYHYDNELVTILDSGYYSTKYISSYRKQYVQESGIRSMIFSTLEAVDSDTVTRSTRYYLYSK